MTRSVACLSLVACVAALLLWPQTLQAHRVNLFCWVEKEQVVCQASTPDGSPLADSSVTALMPDGEAPFLTTTTDAQGQASFPIPTKARDGDTDLKVVLEASMGHKASWTVRAEELARAPAEDSHGSAGTARSKEAQSLVDSSQKQSRAEAGRSLSREQLEDIVSSAVAKEIGPLKREIRSLQQQRVSIRDVLGGLGYILGLMGIGLYVKSRGSSRE